MSGSHLCPPHNDDVDELVASMIKELIYWRSHSNIDGNRTKCSMIYKVLQCIRASDPNAYEPRVLSIGPYHHGAPTSLPLEKEKWVCLDYVLKLNCNRSLQDYLTMITALEKEARTCYSDDNLIDRKMFVEMLLLDGCFILVSLNGIGGFQLQRDIRESCSRDQNELVEVVIGKSEARVHEKGKQTMVESTAFSLPQRTSKGFALQIEQDHIDTHHSTKRCNSMDSYDGQTQENVEGDEQWYNSSAVYDLLLLENQIPFFVVTKIYELLVSGERSHGLLSDNISKFIKGVLLHFPLAIQDNNSPKDFDHLLHLCYLYFKPSCSLKHKHQMKERTGYFRSLLFWAKKCFFRNFESQEKESNRSSCAQYKSMHSCKEFQQWRRAEQYHDAGVEFKDRIFDEQNPHSLLDIEFRDGVLHIPRLPIDDKSATLFRNLVALEQSCPELGNDIASYVYFLSQLISVPDDVALLSRKGVIVHQLDSDEEVSTLFARLFEYVIFDFYGEHYLKLLCHTLEAHYQSRINRWMAWLWHKHFGNPWLGFTALASVIMVFCSIGQTILAFLSYMNTS